MNMTNIEDMSSHSGLWSTNEGTLDLFLDLCCNLLVVIVNMTCVIFLFKLLRLGGKTYADFIASFTANYSKFSETELHMLSECTH